MINKEKLIELLSNKEGHRFPVEIHEQQIPSNLIGLLPNFTYAHSASMKPSLSSMIEKVNITLGDFQKGFAISKAESITIVNDFEFQVIDSKNSINLIIDNRIFKGFISIMLEVVILENCLIGIDRAKSYYKLIQPTMNITKKTKSKSKSIVLKCKL